MYISTLRSDPVGRTKFSCENREEEVYSRVIQLMEREAEFIKLCTIEG